MNKTVRQARKLLDLIEKARRPLPPDSPAVRAARAIVAAEELEAAWDAADAEWAGLALVEHPEPDDD